MGRFTFLKVSVLGQKMLSLPDPRAPSGGLLRIFGVLKNAQEIAWSENYCFRAVFWGNLFCHLAQGSWILSGTMVEIVFLSSKRQRQQSRSIVDQLRLTHQSTSGKVGPPVCSGFVTMRYALGAAFTFTASA